VNLKPLEMVDTGIDWSTFTFQNPDNAKIAVSKAAILLQSEHLQGDDKRLWSGFGYEGFCCGGVRLGTRPGSVLVQLSGPAAQQHWHKFLPLASNCSRLDLQVTNRYPVDSSTILAKHFKAAIRAHKAGRSQRRVTLLRSSDQSATLYLGSRSSERFGRCYQKDRESRLEHYLDCLRYEVELKGKSSLTVAHDIARQESPQRYIASLVRSWFADASVYFQIPENDGTAFICCSRMRRDDISRLEWLTSDVAPAVKLLLARGYRSRVMSALGISEQQESDRELLCKSPSQAQSELIQ